MAGKKYRGRRGGGSGKSGPGGKKCTKILTAVGSEKVPLDSKGFLVFFEPEGNRVENSANFIKLLEEHAKEVHKVLDATTETTEATEDKTTSTAEVKIEENVDEGDEDESNDGDDSDDPDDDSDEDDDANVSKVSESSPAKPSVKPVVVTNRESESTRPSMPITPSENKTTQSARNLRQVKSTGQTNGNNGRPSGSPKTGLETLVNGGADVLNRRTKQQIKRKNYYLMQAPTMHMEKPQLKFKTRVVNDDSPFKPVLPNKPHAVVPLDLKPKLDPKTKKTFYDHPYQSEIKNWIPPPPFMTYTENSVEPVGLDRTPYLYVETANDLRSMLGDLRQVSEVSFDVEHSDRGYFGLTCLIQLSTRHKDYVIDCFAPDVRESLFRLNDIFANPNILKVAHSAQCDVVYLQRDFGIYVVGLFDTCAAEKVVQSASHSTGLATLLKDYVGVETDKKYQLADWRRRPLLREMIEYARMDTHYLLRIHDLQKKKLLDMNDRQLLFRVYENSKSTCLIRYEKPDWKDWVQKRVRGMTNRQRFAMEELNKWRDGVARREDDSAGMIAANKAIQALAQALPDSETRMIDTLKGARANFTNYMKDDRNLLLKIFQDARQLPLVTGVEPTTRIVCQQVSLDNPNVIFFISEFSAHRKVCDALMDKCNGTCPKGISRILPVDTTSNLYPENINKAVRSLLVAGIDSTTETYKTLTNRPTLVDGIVQEVMTDLKPTWTRNESEDAGLRIVIFVSQPRCFLSVMNSNFRVFKLEGQDFEE